MTRGGAASIALGALAVLACDRGRKPEPEALPTPSASALSATAPGSSAPAVASSSESPPAAAGTLAETRGCRAIAVQGRATFASGAPLERNAAIDGASWFELGSGAQVTVKHTTTSREVTLRGPGTFLACSRAEEEFVVASGTLSTVTQAGARPGAEVWIGTPFGLVRYGDAALEIRVDDRRLAVKAMTGDGWVEEPGLDAVARRVPNGEAWASAPRAPDVKSLVDACERASASSEARARDVLSKEPSAAPLGRRAADHVRARRAARAACLVAAAQLGRTEKGPERDDLLLRVDRAGARFRQVPAL